MYKKVTIILIFLCIAILLYVANKYNAVDDFKFAAAKDFVPYYEAAANQFWLVGIIISFTIWIWIDVVIIKTKQLFWLWIPFVFIAVVAITNNLHEEQLFHFKKANGMWKGGFSLSFFFNIGIIVIAAFLLLFNYFGFKMYFKKIKSWLMRIFKQQFMVTYFAKFIKLVHCTHSILLLIKPE